MLENHAEIIYNGTWIFLTEEFKMAGKKGKKIFVRVLICVLVIFIAALIFAGNYLVNYAIGRRSAPAYDVVPASEVVSEDAAIIEKNRNKISADTKAWYEGVEHHVEEIRSSDGLLLKGEIFTQPDSNLWLVAVHGYSSRRQGMFDVARFYYEKGFNVLAPDNRAHGESEGKWVGMGWLDRKDILLWLDKIIEENPDAKIILHGISMGGATVMMCAGENLPANVKGIVDDCGYTSVWDIFSDELSVLFHLPSFPLLNVASGIAKLRAGYSFGEASSVKAVSNAKVPMLFIHGEKDNFVHTDMVHKVYDVCPTAKKKLIVEGAGHGQSYQMDPNLYFNTVFSFLSERCGLEIEE